MDPIVRLQNHELRIQRLEGKSLDGGVQAFTGIGNFPPAGDPEAIYMDTTNGAIYFWDGTQYQPIGTATAGASVSFKTGDYMLTAGDDGVILIMNSAVAMDVVCPAGMRPGFACEVWQWGIGQATASPSGVAIYQADNHFMTRKQYSVMSIRYASTNEVMISGDLA